MDFLAFSHSRWIVCCRSMQRVDEEIINYDLIEDVLLLLLVNRDQCTLEAPEGSDLSRGSILGTTHLFYSRIYQAFCLIWFQFSYLGWEKSRQ